MIRFRDLENMITPLLEADELCRGDDHRLYVLLFRSRGIRLEENTFAQHAAYGIPSFDSIRRCRQKIQAKRPELSADRHAVQQRKAAEAQYRAYAVDSRNRRGAYRAEAADGRESAWR